MTYYNYQQPNQYQEYPSYPQYPYHDDNYQQQYQQQDYYNHPDEYRYQQQQDPRYEYQQDPRQQEPQRYYENEPIYYQTNDQYLTNSRALYGKSRLDRKVYINGYSPTPFDDATEQQPYYPQTQQINYDDPANIPYIPYQDSNKLLDQEVADFIQNLPKYTKHQEEIDFARYLAQSLLIDAKLAPLQSQLSKDGRFSSRLLFEYFDAHKSNHLDYQEFKWGLNKLDIHFKDDDCHSLFCRVANEDSRISFTEFHELLLGVNDLPQSFHQFGAYHYMHLPMNKNQQQQQFFSVLQRDLINQIIENQLYIEQQLTHLRQTIGQDDILLALFRQIDRGSKGYLVIEDLQQYLIELGAEFDFDLTYVFNRISKIRSNRINFKEFKREFHVDTYHDLMRRQALSASPNKQRQQDFIEYLNINQQVNQRQREQQQQQENQRLSQQQQSRSYADPTHQPQQVHQQPPPTHEQERDPHEFQNFNAPVTPVKAPVKASVAPIEAAIPVSFPGFTKYQLREPRAHQPQYEHNF